MHNPIVSIIIPTYNRGHLITETLDSIRAQTCRDWECIIVDDGSGDDTKEKLELYTTNDSRFKYINRPSHIKKGANGCRNYGFKYAKGKYIQWFDSDDIMYPNLLEEKVAKLEENESYNFCLSRMEAFRVENNENKVVRITDIKSNNVFEDYVAGKISIGSPTVLWRKHILINETLFDEKLTQSQDLEFNSRMLFKYKKGALINKALLMFRVSHNSISTSFLANKEMHLQSFLEVRRRIINLDNTNLKTNESVIKSVLAILRSCLAERKYKASERALKFILNNNKNTNFSFLIKLKRIQLAYYVFKLLGRGDTKFKRLLKL